MRQYEIRWANLPAPVGRRPVLLLSRTEAYGYLNCRSTLGSSRYDTRFRGRRL
jgi:hypothetical protein